MKRFNARLPRKMSALIRVALADLIKTEKTPGYAINMGLWHELHASDERAPSQNLICYVCFAGATLAQRGYPRRRREMNLEADVSAPLRKKMYALNALRIGEVAEAASELGLLKRDRNGELVVGEKLDEFNALNTWIVPYTDNPAQFKRNMRNLANKLERHGL